MPRNLRIRVDHDVCVGNAMCETIAQKVFRLNDNRQSEVVDPGGDTVEKIIEAAENCQVSAIFVRKRGNGERNARKIDALVLAELAAIDDLAFHILAACTKHPQLNQTIREQDASARTHFPGQLLECG